MNRLDEIKKRFELAGTLKYITDQEYLISRLEKARKALEREYLRHGTTVSDPWNCHVCHKPMEKCYLKQALEEMEK